MNDLIDNFARILATPMSRRKAFKLFGGAFAAAVVGVAGIQTVAAKDCTKSELNSGSKTCGQGTSSKCCAAGTCCTAKGNVVSCCTKAQCVCTNGTCASSTGAICPSGCSKCVA